MVICSLRLAQITLGIFFLGVSLTCARRGFISSYKPGAHIPEHVAESPALFDTTLFQPHGGINAKWASSIYAWSSDAEFANDVSAKIKLSAFHKILGHKNVLYRGLDRWTFFTSMLARNPRDFSMESSDFGDGIYYTESYEMAKSYSGSGGVITIYDWSSESQPLTIKELSDDQWRTVVKYHVAHIYPYKQNLVPMSFDDDFWRGSISVDHAPVKRCSDPIPSQAIQVVAKTQKAYDLMATRLLAVIFLI